MRLPYSTELSYINYILTTARDLSDGSNSCSVRTLVETCNLYVLSGRVDINYSELLYLCQHARLLRLKNGKASITNLGFELLNLNITPYYEFTDGQKEWFAKQLIFSGPWKNVAKRIFSFFYPDHEEHTFMLNDDVDLNTEQRATIFIFQVFGILIKNNNRYALDSKYVKYVIKFRSEEKGISQDELEEKLERNKEFGFKAEELIVLYEQQRLRRLGRNAEADRVVRISQLEADAGFDIRSFNGDEPSADYDRFIEVKASQQGELLFFMSNNEIAVSGELGSQYWVYFVGNFDIEKRLDELSPVLIQNPSEGLLSHPSIECKPDRYKIRQKGELPLDDLDTGISGRIFKRQNDGTIV